MAQPLDERDPRQIGPYGIHGRLGAGGMGQVYLGRAADGNQAAVKVIHPGLAHDEQFRARFRREVNAARRVDHPCVARVLDADPDARHPWLATEYVPGQSLEQAVTAPRPLPEASVRIMAASLFAALAAIHDNGVLHRDIKPSNILLGPDRPKLIDFGVARATESTQLTRTGMILGSPAFMSPEQANGDEVSTASDVYSLAAVLVFASTGVGPFGEGSPAALLLRATETTPDLDAVPESVRPMLELCLATDPAARPTADVLAAALAAGTADAAGAPGNSTTGWLPPPLAESAPRAVTPPADARQGKGGWLFAGAMIVTVIALVAFNIAAWNVGNGVGSAPVSSVTASPTSPPPEPVFLTMSDSTEDVAFSPDSRRAYVVNYHGVEVVDTSINQIIATMTFGDIPLLSGAVTPDGAHLYIGSLTGYVMVLDTTTNATITTIPVGEGPEGISFTPDGGRAFVLNGHDGTLSVIDTRSHTVNQTIDVTPSLDALSARRMVVRPDGGQVYVLTDDGIVVVNTGDYSTWFWRREVTDVALAPDSTAAHLLTSYPGVVDVLDTTGARKATIPLDGVQAEGPDAIAIAPDGRHLVVLYAGSLVVLDVATGDIVDTIPVEVSYIQPAVRVAPDGRQIYVVGGYDARIAVIDSTKYS